MNNKRPLAIAFDPARRQATLGLLLAATLLLFAQSVLANTPTIRLFPTTVVEDLKQTGNVARDMETGLQSLLMVQRDSITRAPGTLSTELSLPT